MMDEMTLLESIDMIQEQSDIAAFMVQESLVKAYSKHIVILQESSEIDDSCMNMILEADDTTSNTETTEPKKRPLIIRAIIRIFTIIRNMFRNLWLKIRKFNYKRNHKQIIDNLKKAEIEKDIPTNYKDIDSTIGSFEKISSKLEKVYDLFSGKSTMSNIEANLDNLQNTSSMFSMMNDALKSDLQERKLTGTNAKSFLLSDCKYTCNMDQLNRYFEATTKLIDIVTNLSTRIDKVIDLYIVSLKASLEALARKEDTDAATKDIINKYGKNINYEDWQKISTNMISYASYVIKIDYLWIGALKLFIEEQKHPVRDKQPASIVTALAPA